MEQRTPRLGDTVDDYCPRERRLTNHVVVAIVEDAIRQTRCATCDVEHEYKAAKEPRRRRKEPGLYDQVLSDLTGGTLVAPRTAAAADAAPAPHASGNGHPHSTRPNDAAPATSAAQASAEAPEPTEPLEDAQPAGNEPISLHRRLIRASLPRTEGELPPARVIPEFTMHQRTYGRGGHGGFRHGGGGGGFGGHSQPRFGRPGGGGGNPNGNVDGNTANGNRGDRGGAPNGGPPGAGGQPGGGGRRRRGGRHKHPPR